MLILDRYILRQFVQTMVICYLSLMGLFIVFDAFTKLNEFQRWGERHGGIWAVMAPYYGCKAVWFFDQTSGLLMLTAAMFTVSWIQRHNEMTALLAAGISRLRVVVPIIAAVVVLSILSTVNRELVIPQLRGQLTLEPKDMATETGIEPQFRYDYRTNICFRGRHLFVDEQRIEAPDFFLPTSLDRYGRALKADNAFYCPPTPERPGGYLFRGVQEPKGLQHQPSLTLGNQPVVITPRDAPQWLAANECFVVSDLTFEQFAAPRDWARLSSLAELIRGIHNPSLDFGADKRVVIHTRVVQPLLDLTLLFLGLPLVLNRRNRNVFLAIGLCAVVTSSFVVVVMVFQFLGNSEIFFSPALAAWAPLMVFVPLAVGLANSMRE